MLAPLAVFLLGYWLHGRFGTEADAANLIPGARGLGFVGLLLALPTAQFLSAAADSLVRSKQLAALLLPLAAAIVAVNPSPHPRVGYRPQRSRTPRVDHRGGDRPSRRHAAVVTFRVRTTRRLRTSFGIVHPELWITSTTQSGTP